MPSPAKFESGPSFSCKLGQEELTVFTPTLQPVFILPEFFLLSLRAATCLVSRRFAEEAVPTFVQL